MKKKNDIRYTYVIRKLAQKFKDSNQTTNYEEIDRLLEFTETILPVSETIDNRVFIEVALLLSQLTRPKTLLEDIDPETNLSDLGMSKTDKRFLKKPFNRIIDFLEGSNQVYGYECENCLTVKECVELIKSKL